MPTIIAPAEIQETVYLRAPASSTSAEPIMRVRKVVDLLTACATELRALSTTVYTDMDHPHAHRACDRALTGLIRVIQRLRADMVV